MRSQTRVSVAPVPEQCGVRARRSGGKWAHSATLDSGRPIRLGFGVRPIPGQGETIMDTRTLTALRRMIEAGMDDATIQDVFDLFGETDEKRSAATETHRILTAAVARRTVQRSTVAPVVAPERPNVTAAGFVKPDTTRTAYRLTPVGRRLTTRNPGGNNGEVIQYFATIDNAWSDTRAMRSAGVLAHGERDGKNKALESAIHGMKTRGWLTMRDKPEHVAAPRLTPRGTEI